ncbi:MAG: spondin domain-containing protein [Gammaproteobacteria bacterium]|nr:spondin domain-containing protein [Gammaproteobacteria bacterium]
MNKKILLKPLAVSVSLSAALMLSACSDSDDEDKTLDDFHTSASYEITVTNLTNGQPLTPVAGVLHRPGYQAWSVGKAASEGLEQLAEGGATAAFLAEADADLNVITSGSGSAPFGPGASQTVALTVTTHDQQELDNATGQLHLSAATMLANTNDAFAGVIAWDVSGLAAGDSMSRLLLAHDAGTEANTETLATMPGPASDNNGDGNGDGEGFNGVRDDLGNFVTVHSGVVTADDGLATSALDESHRWLGPVAKITIERIN